MIAGETEILLADHLKDDTYDDFLFFGNKEKRAQRKAARKARRLKRRSDPKRIARRERRRSFFKKLGKAYEDLGGGAAIGGAIDTLIRKPNPVDVPDSFPSGDTTTRSDYSIGIGDTQTREPEKKDTSNTVLIIGGVTVVVAVVGLMVYQSQKNKYVSIQQK